MRRLVVVEAHGTDEFVAALRRAWDDGDAVFPLDPRLPPPAREAVLDAVRPSSPVEPDDALVVATSGTTGVPKAAVLTHAAVAAAAEATSAHLSVDPDRDHWLACLPLAHVGGLGVVTRALHTGTPLTVVPDAQASTLAAATDATLVSLVPALLTRVDAARFRVVVLGGSAMPPDLPPNAVATYGMTETGGGVVYDGTPLAGVEIRIGEDDGQIHLRAPMLLRCYRDGSDPRDADGWLPTGDAGSWDGTRLTVAGRIGDLIITGGEKVWPTQVERVLELHPEVAEAQVFAREDPRWGHRVVARIVPTTPAAPPTLATLRAWTKESLPPWSAPQELELAESLPRTPLGKLRRGPAKNIRG